MRKFAVITTVEGTSVEFVNYVAAEGHDEAEQAVMDLFNMNDMLVETLRADEISRFPHENVPVVNAMS